MTFEHVLWLNGLPLALSTLRHIPGENQAAAQTPRVAIGENTLYCMLVPAGWKYFRSHVNLSPIYISSDSFTSALPLLRLSSFHSFSSINKRASTLQCWTCLMLFFVSPSSYQSFSLRWKVELAADLSARQGEPTVFVPSSREAATIEWA